MGSQGPQLWRKLSPQESSMTNSFSAKGKSLFAMPPHNGIWASLMCRSYDFSHSCDEFILAVGLLCLPSKVLLQTLTTSSSYNLSTPLLVMPPAPWGKGCNLDISFGAKYFSFLFSAYHPAYSLCMAGWECLYKFPSSKEVCFQDFSDEVKGCTYLWV